MMNADKERFLGMPKSVFWSIFGALVIAGILGGINLHTQQAVASQAIVDLKEDVAEIKGDVSSIQEDVAAQATQQTKLSTDMEHVMDEQKNQGTTLNKILDKLNE